LKKSNKLKKKSNIAKFLLQKNLSNLLWRKYLLRRNGMKIARTPAVLLLFTAIHLASCSEKNSNNNELVLGLLLLNQGLSVAKATDLVNESEEDYAKNNWGLIEHSKLQSWISDWQANKPSHIPADGKLIVLQINAANSNFGFVPSNPAKGNFTFQLDRNFVFNQQRDNGLVSESVYYQADGKNVDQFLKLYGIHLKKDLVVFVSGDGNAGDVQTLARGIYWLRYWGADIRNLALLNGNLKDGNKEPGAVSWNLSTNPSNPPNNGTFSVRQLRVDNSIITLPLEDVLTIVDDNLETKKVPGITGKQFIIDARPLPQYNRTANGHDFTTNGTTNTNGLWITTSYASSGPPGGGIPKTYNLSEGYIKGAVNFFWQELFQGDSDAERASNGFRYKSKSDLQTIFQNKGYTKKATVVSQCRTNFEVQVNGFAALNILGYPTVYYDGSLVEWTSLVSEYPEADGVAIVNLEPGDPAYRFRTDSLSRRSGNFAYNPNTGGNRVKQAKINRNATTTRKLHLEDRAYKR